MSINRTVTPIVTNRPLAICATSVPRCNPSGVTLLLAGLMLAAVLGAGSRVIAADSESLALFRGGKYAECIEAATKAIAEEVINETDRSLKIRAELALGRYKDAAETLEEGLKRIPGSLELRWLGRDVSRYNNQPERVLELESQIVGLVEKSPWQYGDAPNRTVIARFLLSQGADPKKVLNGIINEIKRLNSSFTPAYLVNGELALEKGDYALAAEAFAQAAKIDPAEPDAYFGMAQAFAPSDSAKAQAALKEVFDRNPNHVAGLLLMVDGLVDSERYDLADGSRSRSKASIRIIRRRQPTGPFWRLCAINLPTRSFLARRQLKFLKTNPGVDYLI